MKKLEYSAQVKPLDVENFVRLYEDNLKSILSQPELKLLTATKLVLETILESKSFLEVDVSNLKIKENRKPESTRLIYLGGSPAFHSSQACERLNQDYINYEIPVALPEHRIQEYRSFFLENISLLKEDPERFYVRVSTKFGLTTQSIRSIHYDNSGADQIRNIQLNAKDLVKKLKSHISDMESFRTSSPDVEKMIKNFGYATHQAKDFRVGIKFIDMDSDNPVKKWHSMKQVLKGILLDHIIATINPELAFEKSVLEAAGFIPCRECHKPNDAQHYKQLLTNLATEN